MTSLATPDPVGAIFQRVRTLRKKYEQQRKCGGERFITSMCAGIASWMFTERCMTGVSPVEVQSDGFGERRIRASHAIVAAASFSSSHYWPVIRGGKVYGAASNEFSVIKKLHPSNYFLLKKRVATSRFADLHPRRDLEMIQIANLSGLR